MQQVKRTVKESSEKRKLFLGCIVSWKMKEKGALRGEGAGVNLKLERKVGFLEH